MWGPRRGRTREEPRSTPFGVGVMRRHDIRRLHLRLFTAGPLPGPHIRRTLMQHLLRTQRRRVNKFAPPDGHVRSSEVIETVGAVAAATGGAEVPPFQSASQQSSAACPVRKTLTPLVLCGSYNMNR